MEPVLLAGEIKEILSAVLGDLVYDVILFGSHISKKNRPDSDYDVLIILKGQNTRETRRMISDLCYDLDLKYNIFIDDQIITMEEMKYGIRGKHPLFMDALKEGIHAYHHSLYSQRR
jgi:predicted nucleotidyltransferase